MKQERLIRSLEFIERVIERAECAPVAMARGNGKSVYLTRYAVAMGKQALQIYRPIRHALNKAIEKPTRKDGNRAFCPDCGTTASKRDNYCRTCGQRLKIRETEKKSFYTEYGRKNKNRRLKPKKGNRKNE